MICFTFPELSSPSNQVKNENSDFNGSCFYDSNKQSFIPHQQQHKQFNSVPDNMNLLSTSPSQNYLNNSFYATGNNNSSGGFNNTSSTGSISDMSNPSNYLNSSAVLSPTDEAMDLDRFPSPSNNTFSWMEDNTITFQGISPKEQFAASTNLNMPSNGFVNGGGEFNSPNNSLASNPQAVYEPRSQTSILYRSSPKPQDGFVSLYDLEGPEY